LGGRVIDKITASGQDGYMLDTYLNKLRFIIGGQALSSANDLPTVVWVHVAATYDGATMTLYINGVPSGTLAATGAIPTNALSLKLGADSTGANRFNGLIDEARVFNRALTPAEVNNLYLAGLSKGGVVSWWHGESTFADALGLNAGVSGGAAGFAAGQVGQGINLTGAATSFVDAADSASLDFTTAITMDAWINPTALGGRIFDKITAGGQDGYMLDTLAGKLRMIAGNSALSSAADLPLNVPTHVAGAFSTATGNMKVYINGNLAGTLARAAAIPANALPLRIGADSTGANRFTGTIDEPRVFGRELTAAEISALYHEVRCQ